MKEVFKKFMEGGLNVLLSLPGSNSQQILKIIFFNVSKHKIIISPYPLKNAMYFI